MPRKPVPSDYYQHRSHKIDPTNLSTGEIACRFCGRLVTTRKGVLVHTAVVVW